MISGFGGKQGTLSSRSIGRQSVADRCGSADSLIRAIGGAEIATWLDADDITVADGANVTTWTAKQGNSPSQNSGTPRPPDYVVDGINGKPAVNFAATNECLQWAAEGLNASDIPAVTVASTNRSSVAGTDSGIVFELGTANYHTVAGLIMAYSSNGGGVDRRMLIGIGGSGDESFRFSTSERTPNINNVMVGVYDRSTSNDTLNGFINSEPITPAASQDGDRTNAFDFDGQISNLGARANGSVGLNGSIREFIVIKRALTGGEAFRLAKALMINTGLTTLLSQQPNTSLMSISHFTFFTTIYCSVIQE